MLPIVLFLTLPALAPPPVNLVVDDFDVGVQNRLSGYRNGFQRAPSTAKSMRTANPRRGGAGRSFQVTAKKAAKGFCGSWIHLFDFRAAKPKYFDSTKYKYLSFWVRGKHGGETFLVKLADRSWIAKEDSLAVGRVEQFLDGKVTTEWQEVRIPLDRIGKLDRRQLGAVIFEFDRTGSWQIYVDDIAFKATRDTLIATNQKLTKSGLKASSPGARRQKRSMWVWETKPLLDQPQQRRRLWQFCRDNRVNLIWLQALYRRTDQGVALLEKQSFAQLLREAHQRNIKVHALDGYPEFALAEFHHVPISLVKAIIRFNRGRQTRERFDGVHLDNEPYLLVGWQDKRQRRKILKEYLKLNDTCQRLIRAEKGLQYGVDIPFWWHQQDEQGQPIATVKFAGKRQSVSFHCIDRLDNVGIMNYRDQAHGADGMIAHGQALLRYADQSGRASIFMGSETFRSAPTTVRFVLGPTFSQWRKLAADQSRLIPRRSRLHGQRLHTLNDGNRIHVGVESGKDEPATSKALWEVAERLNLRSTSPEQILNQVEKRVRRLPQLSRFKRRDLLRTNRRVIGFQVKSVMLSKVTFADDSPSDFRLQINLADDFFNRFPSYNGTAIHCYKSFRKLLVK